MLVTLIIWMTINTNDILTQQDVTIKSFKTVNECMEYVDSDRFVAKFDEYSDRIDTESVDYSCIKNRGE